MQFIHVIVDAFIHGFYAAGDHNLTMKLLSLIFADQRFKLFDEFIGFLVSDELCRLKEYVMRWN